MTDPFTTPRPAPAQKPLSRREILWNELEALHAGQRIKKGILYAKEIGSLLDALFSAPQSEEQCCELDRSTARFLAVESYRESLAYDAPVFMRSALDGARL